MTCLALLVQMTRLIWWRSGMMSCHSFKMKVLSKQFWCCSWLKMTLSPLWRGFTTKSLQHCFTAKLGPILAKQISSDRTTMPWKRSRRFWNLLTELSWACAQTKREIRSCFTSQIMFCMLLMIHGNNKEYLVLFFILIKKVKERAKSKLRKVTFYDLGCVTRHNNFLQTKQFAWVMRSSLLYHNKNFNTEIQSSKKLWG